ncbi:toll/interleukin-1 receptor domain-containing protein [Pseudomonas sp. PAB10]|uniref:toll/interleukin-1 receptor domain-containing protein n=1 Tax=Pseudomonas sp. PAB10 TaxID=3233047 RepID=UPI003F97F873
MADSEKRGSVFISYAWGGSWEGKEWVRERIVANLDWRFNVFWDRDSIPYGETIERAIGTALSERPMLVLCLCDQAYLEAAQRIGSGLHSELRALSQIAGEPGVRIVPLIFDDGCAERLPTPLIGRLYLDLRPLHQRGLDLGTALLGVAENISQGRVQHGINQQLAIFNLRRRALEYLQRQPLTIWGNALTHEVTVRPDDRPPFLLLAPQWMWNSDKWSFMLSDENSTYCPTKGRWHWDHFTPSLGMRALGTAVLSTFFPQLGNLEEQPLLNAGGVLLAVHFFSIVKVTEPFTFDADDLITFLFASDEGFAMLEELLNAVDTQAVSS